MSNLCYADDAIDIVGLSTNPNLDVRGYLYQGLVKSNNNNYKGNSSMPWGSLEDRSMGISATYQVNSNLDLRAAVKVHQSGDRVSSDPAFDYALVDIHTQEVSISNAGLRLGKVRNELGFYNATMENPTSRDMDVAPQAIYRMTLEEFLNSGKGIQLYFRTKALPYVNITLEYANVYPEFTPREDVLSSWFTLVPTGNFDTTKTANSLHALITTKDLRWMARFDRFNVKAAYIRGDRDFIPSGDLDVIVSLLGARKYFDSWDVTYEIMKTEQVGSLWSVIRPNGEYSLSHNVVVRKVINQNWTGYIGYNEWLSDHTDPRGVKSSSRTRGTAPPQTFYSTDLNLGLNYTYSNSWRVRSSYHWITGITALSPIDNPDRMRSASKDEMFTLSVTYSF